jgi:glycosyltransferase involved in cell wall biosynthesis
MNKDRIWCVIPVYNNADTVKKIVENCFKYINNILVIDDGSNDTNILELLKETDAKIIQHEKNRGKGAALLTALNFIKEKNALSMITIDADGQHLPEDIPKFIDEIERNPESLHIGIRDFNQTSIPESSRFGRKFSNMWFKIETGKECKDTQSGFRAYPVKLISQLNLYGSFYDFEIEVIARASWAQIRINEINISVVYDPPEKRVSHFNKIKDNIRISLMHTRLVGRRLVPIPHKKLIDNSERAGRSLLLHPVKFFKILLKENATPMGLALSAAVGTIFSVLPIIGLHTIIIIYVTSRLHLNKIMALSIQIIYSPPFVPFICIEAGHYLLNGRFIVDFTLSGFMENWKSYFIDWLVGSLVLVPIYTIVAFFAVYYIAIKIQKKISDNEQLSEI